MQKTMPQRAIVIGVMGGANVSDRDIKDAYELGRLIAENGWVLLNGGRNCGIMDASARGAHENGGITAVRAETIELALIGCTGIARGPIKLIPERVVFLESLQCVSVKLGLVNERAGVVKARVG